MLINNSTYIPLQQINIQLQENKSTYTKHDLLFKRLIKTFFCEFIDAFFPQLYEEIDFSSLNFLSEKIIPPIHDNNERRLDIVAEVKWKLTDTIIIHIEPQSYVQTNFNERMFHYFSQLHRKFRQPIIPIAIFTYSYSWDKDTFNMTIGNITPLRFNYLTLHLQKMNWRDYITQKNPVSAALLSKMNYNKDERVEVKLQFLRILSRLEITLEKQDILMNFFQSYLKLTDEEEEILMKKVSKHEDVEKILEVTNPYVERGRKLGREEGLKEGHKKEKLKIARNMLDANFSKEEISQATHLNIKDIEKLTK